MSKIWIRKCANVKVEEYRQMSNAAKDGLCLTLSACMLRLTEHKAQGLRGIPDDPIKL